MKLSHAFVVALIANVIGGFIVIYLDRERGKRTGVFQ